MSWAEARNQLTSVIESLTPVNDGTDLSDVVFENIPEGDATRSRGFWWTVQEIGTVSPTVSGRINLGITLTVVYENGRSTQQTDETIVLDYNALSDAMLNEANWNRPTSTIIALSQGGDEVLLSSVRDTDNLRFLDVNFEMQVST